MNPFLESDRNNLSRALETSFRGLEPFRRLTKGLVEEYAGSHYGQGVGPKYEIVLNLMKQVVDAYTMSLVANRPRIMVTSKRQELQYFADVFATATNNLIEEIGLEHTLRRWVLDAIFGVGVIKVHMADAGPVQLEEDLWMDPGKPFASNVSLDNFVYDMGATKWTQVKFAADCYRIPFADLMESGIYDTEAVRDLKPTSKFGVDDERLERISSGDEIDQDELEPMIDLIDVWIPRDGKIYTFAMDRTTLFQVKGPPVAVMDWTGPEFGPYHLLGFNDVPENIMPTSLAADLAPLVRSINTLMRKQIRRAKNQKTAITYSSGGEDGAKKFQKAGDEQLIQVDDPKSIGALETPGVSPQNQTFMLNCMEMLDRMAGNLSSMLGLGPSSDTVGQEQMISGNVSKKLASMQYRTTYATKCVVRDLGFMLFNDKFKEIPGQIPIEGAAGYSLPATWTPEWREGDFLDYNFDVDIYSMPYRTPAERANAASQLLTTIFIPAAQLLMAQGGQINFQNLTNMYAKLFDMPQLKEIVQFVGMTPQDAAGQAMGEPSGPGTTTREYVRRSVGSGGTTEGRNQAMADQWAGVDTPQGNAMLSRTPA